MLPAESVFAGSYHSVAILAGTVGVWFFRFVISAGLWAVSRDFKE